MLGVARLQGEPGGLPTTAKRLGAGQHGVIPVQVTPLKAPSSAHKGKPGLAAGLFYKALALRAEPWFTPLGAPKSDGLVPHVTLGRVRSSFGSYALVDQLKTVGTTLRDKPFAPTGLVLYRSELRPGGPIYTPLLRRPTARS